MKRTLLCIDGSYQVYRAAAAHPDLIDVEGRFTGGLYGFLQSFGKMVRETEATHVVFCRDSKPYLRSRDYPEYKQLRKKSRDEDLFEKYQASEPLILDLLDVVGIPIWAVPGFEADDLAAHMVRHHRSRFSRIYSASNDSDLYQLLGWSGFAVYKDSIKDAVTADLLLAKTGLTPDEFMLASAMQGTHNDIAGIDGVGEKTAAKAVRDPALMRRYRDSHGSVIDRNLGLIRLPHPEFPRGAVMPDRTRGFDRRAFYSFCDRYDINVTLSMLTAFEQTR